MELILANLLVIVANFFNVGIQILTGLDIDSLRYVTFRTPLLFICSQNGPSKPNNLSKRSQFCSLRQIVNTGNRHLLWNHKGWKLERSYDQITFRLLVVMWFFSFRLLVGTLPDQYVYLPLPLKRSMGIALLFTASIGEDLHSEENPLLVIQKLMSQGHMHEVICMDSCFCLTLVQLLLIH